jgi:HEAT repeat protein/cytochrome c biogenesis protein CcdA
VERGLQPAPPAAESPDPSDEAFTRFRTGTLDVRTLAEVLPRLSSPDDRPVIREKILEAEEPPTQALVALLDHPLLAVRLASLELLEEMAGGDLGYNPWTPAESPENTAALERWRQWTGRKTTDREGLFSDDQRRAWLRDLLAGDNDMAARARRMWQTEGLPAVGYLETFLQETPTLPAGSRARIREAQYQITLARQFGDQASTLARHLAFGNRDQLLAALGTIRSSGPSAVPILRDFITHNDPLVRETAIDAMLVAGGEPAVDLLAPLLTKEPDVNVIHGALRRLKDIRTPASASLIARFLDHPDEDLLITAIQASIFVSGSGEPFSSSRGAKTSDSDAPVIALLEDERWRVRAAALEYIEKRKTRSARDKAVALLDDPDEFVRSAAIKACVALAATDALPQLKRGMAENPTMAPMVFAAYSAMKRKPDAEMLATLDAAPAEVRMATVRAIAESSPPVELLQRFAADADTDVACIALRALASDDDHVKLPATLGLLVAALNDGTVPAKADVILENLRLPPAKGGAMDPRLLTVAEAIRGPREATALDPLYDAFLVPFGEASANSTLLPSLPQSDMGELLVALKARLTPETPPGQRFHAALQLARAGHDEGYAKLLEELPDYDTSRKTTICYQLHEPSSADALPLLTALLRDPVAEVRSAAIRSALSNEQAKALIALVFTELRDPAAPLQASEAYDYRFESIARSSSSMMRPWCAEVLGDAQAEVPLKVLACVAARHCADTELRKLLEENTKSAEPLVRRAAWHALLSLRSADLNASAAAIAEDPEALVRAVLPDRIIRQNYSWQHYFTDALSARDNHYVYGSDATPPRINEETTALLAKLAATDPSPLVRFECSFALLTRGSPIDFDAFAKLLPQQPKDNNSARRIADWLEENAERATPALRPLLTVIDTSTIGADELKVLNARVNPGLSKGLFTFADLAKAAAPDSETTDGPLLAPEKNDDREIVRDSLEVVYFLKPGCAECAQARQMLDSLRGDFPLLRVIEHNILSPDGTVLNQALCNRLDVPSTRQTVAPAIFTQAGFVIGPEITPAAVTKLLAETMAIDQDDSWREIETAEAAAAEREVDRRYQALTLPVVLIAGLLDGINPCAFATIIFFLSYLQIARRTPREMLLTGAAFISAVFLAYFSAGFIFHQFLDVLHARIGGLQKWLNFVFAALALVAAILSFRDALRARAGRMDEMTLQLPGLLKDRIRGVIRTGARARRFVIAAFLSGIVISFLELACTGQVYAPIVYQIHQGRLDAVLWLALYNLAFILPLIVIFLLAYGGLRSETLVEFQKKHTFTVKLALAALFLLLAAFLLFGNRLLGH